MLIDTHCHLNFPDYQADLEEVVKRSHEAGVNKIICVSSNLLDSEKAIEVSKKFPNLVCAAVGIHPQKTDLQNKIPIDLQIKKLKILAKEKEVIAIGETGLDFSFREGGIIDRSKEEQFYILEEQIKIAQELNLPLIIHCRKAWQELMEFLMKYSLYKVGKGKKLRGVFHCYSGGKKMLKQVADLGFYIGIDGNITYDEGLENVLKLIPVSKILLETDSPYLSPEPYRGQRNEPKNIKIIAERVAKIKEIPYKELERLIQKNVEELLAV